MPMYSRMGEMATSGITADITEIMPNPRQHNHQHAGGAEKPMRPPIDFQPG